MPAPLVYLLAAASVGAVGFLLAKKMDIKFCLFGMGIVLMWVALAAGQPLAVDGFESCGIALLDPLAAVAGLFKQTMSLAGFTMLVLGGYAAYMGAIGATDAAVAALTRPVAGVRSPYLLIPAVFLLEHVLSLVVPSASSLAIILMATLFPVLRRAGMSTLTAAALIATSATIMPTPLGSDNVAIAKELAALPAFEGLSVTRYVVSYHAVVSVPTLLFMAAVHAFWQRFCDRREPADATPAPSDAAAEKDLAAAASATPAPQPAVLAVLPLLPIVLLAAAHLAQVFAGSEVTISVEVATLFSLAVAVACDCAGTRDARGSLYCAETFFRGMGAAVPTVALLVAAATFVAGLKSLGLFSQLQQAMVSINGEGLGIVLPLALVALTALIVLLSGSGTALFFAMVPLIPALAAAAGISPVALSVPMGLAGNLLRAVSPVSAVVVIVAGGIGRSPGELVRRTSVPMVAGVAFMFALSMALFL